MQHIVNRIPEEWGKYLSIPSEWNDLVFLLDAAIAQIAPDYTVHQVKEKFGGLRYYIDESTVPSEKREFVRGLVWFAEYYAHLIPID